MTSDFRDSTGQCAWPDLINGLAATFGLSPLACEDIPTVRELAQARIAHPLVPASIMMDVQGLTGSSVFTHVENDAPTGMVAFAPLRAAGLKALEHFEFDPGAFPLTLVARPGEPPHAIYGWGFVATTKAGGRAVVKGLAAIQERLFWAIPKYSHLVTGDGERLGASMGYVRVPGPDPYLALIPGATAAAARGVA